TPNGKTAENPFGARVETGSWDSWRGQGHASGTAGALDFYAGGNAFRSDGYREQERSRQARGTLNLGYAFGEDNEVRAIGYAATIRQGVPGALSLEDALNNPRFAGAGVVARRQARDQDVFRGTLQTRLRLSDALVFEGGVYATQTDLHHP